MVLRQIVLLWALLLGGLPPGAVAAPDQAAVDAARLWLARTDAGQWRESWQAGAQLLQASVGEPDFSRSLSAARVPLGALRSRGLAEARPYKVLPGAPDGDYVVLKFNTVFEHKQVAQETVTVVREADGVYRVAGYFIR